MVGKKSETGRAGIDRRTVLQTGAGALAVGASGGLISLRGPRAAHASEPKRGGVLRLSTSEEPFANAFDSHRIISLLTLRVGYLAYNGLVNIDSNRNVVPDLAESWEQPDSQTYIFNLRQGVKFHDGTDFSANDVKFTVERILDPDTASPYVAEFNEIDSVEVLSAYQVRVSMKRPFSPQLANFRRSIFPIISPTAIEKHMATDTLKGSIGTGPFKFVSYTRGDKVVLERNDDYWGGPAYLDGIEVHIIPEQSTALAALQTGGLDYMMQTNPEFADQIRANPDLQLLTTPSPIWDYVAYNVEREPFTDKRVRQAFSMAFDREGIAHGIYKGLAVPAHHAISPAFEAYHRENADIPYQYYDPERARSLLEEAGFDFDQTIRFDTFTERPWGLVGDACAAQLAAIGIKLEIVKPDFNTFAAYFYGTKDYWIGNSSWTGGGVDPDAMMYKQLVSGEVYNVGNYSNPEVDDLLKRARSEIDIPTRADLYNQANRICMEECPVAFLVFPNLVEGMRKDVMGYRFRDEFAGPMDECWLDR